MSPYDPTNWYWTIGSDLGNVYSSAQKATIAVTDATYVAWLAADNAPTIIDTMLSLVEVLRTVGVPPYHKVSTYTIIRRLETAGLIDAADTALTANKTLWRRFYTVGTIDADDADSRTFLTAIGANLNTILAPE